MYDDILIFEGPHYPSDDSWMDVLSKSQVNIVNMHTAMYGLFLIYEDESSGKNAKIFRQARDILSEELSPEKLYDIMAGDAGNYQYDLESVMDYATRIIDFRKTNAED